MSDRQKRSRTAKDLIKFKPKTFRARRVELLEELADQELHDYDEHQLEDAEIVAIKE